MGKIEKIHKRYRLNKIKKPKKKVCEVIIEEENSDCEWADNIENFPPNTIKSIGPLCRTPPCEDISGDEEDEELRESNERIKKHFKRIDLMEKLVYIEIFIFERAIMKKNLKDKDFVCLKPLPHEKALLRCVLFNEKERKRLRQFEKKMNVRLTVNLEAVEFRLILKLLEAKNMSLPKDLTELTKKMVDSYGERWEI